MPCKTFALITRSPLWGRKVPSKIPRLGELLSGENGDGECIGGTTSSTHFKQMTNTNIAATTKKTGIKQAASLVAMAVAPLAIVMGVAAMNAPSAEAYGQRCVTQCFNYGCETRCY